MEGLEVDCSSSNEMFANSRVCLLFSTIFEAYYFASKMSLEAIELDFYV